MLGRLIARGPERGTTLILAMVFLLAIGLVILATASFAVGANSNTINAKSHQTTLANVEAEASAAIQGVRSSYLYPGCSLGPPPTCPSIYSDPAKTPNGVSYSCTPTGVISTLKVNCVGFGGFANGDGVRTVDFYVCPSGVADCAASAASSQVALFAEVQYRDLPVGEQLTDSHCTPTPGDTLTCGLTVSFTAWDVRLADS